MVVRHIVMMTFKSTTAPEHVQTLIAHFASLKDTCMHPTTQAPYILSFAAGRENSPEGLAGGMEYIFVLDYASLQDREWYLNKDPAHLKFVEAVSPHVEKIQVVDFEDGKF